LESQEEANHARDKDRCTNEVEFEDSLLEGDMVWVVVSVDVEE
jgi:hypothetical protein